jgi:hypothetical protein
MPAIPLSASLHERPAAILAALGLLSGILSATWGQTYDLEALRPVAKLFLLDPGALPIGVFFGVALGLGMAAWAGKAWAGLFVLVTTLYAWSAAVHTAIRLESNTGDDPHLIAASLCAGAVGAGITQLGCSLFSSELRRPWRIAVTCAVGAAAGLLFFTGERKMLDERLLYLLWQPLVAFCIGLGLSRRGQSA